MKIEELAEIRRAIGDTAPPLVYEDSEIEAILQLTRSRALTIAHFQLSSAISFPSPLPPAPPTLSPSPTAPVLDPPPSTPVFPAMPALLPTPLPPTLDPPPSTPVFPAAPQQTSSIGLDKWRTEVEIVRTADSAATAEWSRKRTDQLAQHQTALAAWRDETQSVLSIWRAQVDAEQAKDSAATNRWQRRSADQLSQHQAVLSAWRDDNQDKLNKFQQELSLYRAEKEILRMKIDLRRDHARIFLDLAKEGGL